MGFLMLAGLIGSIAYSGHIIKNDLKAETIDYQTKPTFSVDSNKRKIRNKFNMICTRAGIKTDNDGNPIKISQCYKGIDYLKYQGYGAEEIEEFKTIYENKYNKGQNNKKNEIIRENKRLLSYCRNHECDTLVVLRKKIYRGDTPEERMRSLLQNKLWQKIVHHNTYIKSDVIGKYEEIWTLKVPKDFFKQIDKNKLYDNICKEQDIYNGF